MYLSFSHLQVRKLAPVILAKTSETASQDEKTSRIKLDHNCRWLETDAGLPWWLRW